MKIIQGQYNEALIYTDLVDNNTIEQIQLLLDQEFTQGLKVRIMPDCHQGVGCVIGTTMTIKDKIVPNLVGVDIGCGMLCINLGKINIDLVQLDNFIHQNIPCGMKVNNHIIQGTINFKNLKCYNSLKNRTYLKKSLGTLGGGNHFIEIDQDETNNKYLIIHTGSRNLGKQVAEIYQNKAIEYQMNKILNKKQMINDIIIQYKKEGKQQEISQKIKEIQLQKIQLPMPKELCYLEGNTFNEYIYDMHICQKFAGENRMQIAKKILSFLNLDITKLSYFETVHNYININDMILRKGSISAYQNEVVLIPINMRDGCIIGVGKGNPEYNYSAPHGAGRLYSRKQATEQINIDQFKESMKDIFSTTVNEKTIDESPFAYKPIETITENIKETVGIIKIIKPIYNFKCDE